MYTRKRTYVGGLRSRRDPEDQPVGKTWNRYHKPAGGARGLCEIEDVENIHKKMETLLGKEGVFLDDVFYCPHHPDKGYPEENPAYKIPCECRKPKTGMIREAAERYNIDLAAPG